MTIEQRKVLLIGLHREDEAFGRDFEEFALELAQKDIGPLDQRRHLIEQCVVVNRSNPRPQRCCDRGQLPHHLQAAGRESGNDSALLGQLIGITVGVAQRDRIALRLEAVPMCVTTPQRAPVR